MLGHVPPVFEGYSRQLRAADRHIDGAHHGRAGDRDRLHRTDEAAGGDDERARRRRHRHRALYRQRHRRTERPAVYEARQDYSQGLLRSQSRCGRSGRHHADRSLPNNNFGGGTLKLDGRPDIPAEVPARRRHADRQGVDVAKRQFQGRSPKSASRTRSKWRSCSTIRDRWTSTAPAPAKSASSF